MVAVAVVAWLVASSCQLLLGLQPRTLDAGLVEVDAGCQRHADCAELPDASVVCVKATGECQSLTNAQLWPTDGGRPTDLCYELYGADPRLENTIVISSLMQMTGPQAGINANRINSVKLAIKQINMLGGVPGPNGQRPLALLVCNALPQVLDAGSHLVNDLKMPVIIGANTSQDTLDLSNSLTSKNGTVLITHASLAASISSLKDEDFTFRVIPSDFQRGPLLVRRINEVEDMLRDAGISPVRFAMSARNDAFGAGTATALNQTLRVNDAGLTDISNAQNVKVNLYDPTKPNQTQSVAELVAFAPHILVGAGTAEVVTQIIGPMEAALGSGAVRPHYVVIDAAKGTELLNLVNDAGVQLRSRVSGTGITPTPESMQNEADFELAYKTEFNVAFPASSGMGPAYDTVYAVAYSLAMFKNEPVNGALIQRGLRRLGTGAASRFNVGTTSLNSAFSVGESGTPLALQGTFSPMEFDSNGDVLGSAVETWCIAQVGSTVVYKSSGQTFNTKTGVFSGVFTHCP